MQCLTNKIPRIGHTSIIDGISTVTIGHTSIIDGISTVTVTSSISNCREWNVIQ